MQPNKVSEWFDNLKFIFVVPAKCRNQPSLRRTLVRHTIMQLIIVSISLVLFILYAALMIYYTISWKSIPVYYPCSKAMTKNQAYPANRQQETGDKKQEIKFSIIIPARNEEKNIK